MGVFGMKWNKLIMVIIIIITHTLNRPFSCVVTAGQLISILPKNHAGPVEMLISDFFRIPKKVGAIDSL